MASTFLDRALGCSGSGSSWGLIKLGNPPGGLSLVHSKPYKKWSRTHLSVSNPIHNCYRLCAPADCNLICCLTPHLVVVLPLPGLALHPPLPQLCSRSTTRLASSLSPRALTPLASSSSAPEELPRLSATPALRSSKSHHVRVGPWLAASAWPSLRSPTISRPPPRKLPFPAPRRLRANLLPNKRRPTSHPVQC